MFYIDTSALISLYVREARSADVTARIGSISDPLIVSSWTGTEIQSALALKVRTKTMSPVHRDEVAAHMRAALISLYRRETVEDADFDIAAEFISRAQTPLRAGDALHLAVCARLGARLITLDQDMSKAARQLRLEVLDI